ncbi:MAG: hypothetical protein H7X94_14985, partial [Vallitaleaceae bacterium]|nr:hypothetical protein [Vallitaleaceae bacterium]
MKKKVIVLIFLSFILLTALTGCVPGDGTYSSEYQAGFFWGVWHGWIAPVSVVWGFFNRDIRVYELNNVGWWYDLGFYIAVISGFGGASI